jgi:DNA-binding MarR family transcriptional regulator
MDVVPLVMRHLRGWMRSERAAGLSVPQFRTLALLGRLGGSPLTAVAEHLGLSAASVSRMVQGLVTKGLVVREPGTSDRRQVSLRLSDRGRSVMNAARRRTEMHLAEVLSSLSAEQRAEVSAAAALLRDAFGPANPAGE